MKNWEQEYYSGKILNGLYGFRGKYSILSNFHQHEEISIKLPYKGKNAREYFANNVETLFQAAKSNNIKEIEEIIKAKLPNKAKSLGRKVHLRIDWEEIKLNVMKELLVEKYSKVSLFKDILQTIPDNLFIVEMNTWNDKNWGVSAKDFNGHNYLGNMLMELKKEKNK